MVVKLSLNAKFLRETDTELHYRFSGKLSENGVGLANEIVVLQMKCLSPNELYPSEWSDFGGVVTDASGGYSYDWLFYREYFEGYCIAVRGWSVRLGVYSSELVVEEVSLGAIPMALLFFVIVFFIAIVLLGRKK